MITTPDTLRLLTMLQCANLTMSAEQRANMPVTVEVYTGALNAAGISLGAAIAAVHAYIAEPDPAQYPKPFPDPGKLIGRTERGRVMLALGSDADADGAFGDFWTRMQQLAFRPDRDVPARHLDPGDPYRNDAMFQALRTCGGGRTVGGWSDPPSPAQRGAWRVAYREARRPHATVPDAVTLALPQTALSRALSGPTS